MNTLELHGFYCKLYYIPKVPSRALGGLQKPSEPKWECSPSFCPCAGAPWDPAACLPGFGSQSCALPRALLWLSCAELLPPALSHLPAELQDSPVPHLLHGTQENSMEKREDPCKCSRPGWIGIPGQIDPVGAIPAHGKEGGMRLSRSLPTQTFP